MQPRNLVRKLITIAFPLAVALLLASCGDGRPSGILSESEIVPVLKDLHIGYAGIDLTIPDAKLREPRYAEINQVVFDKHKVDEKVFFESYEYYQQNPRLMDTIYNAVINSLNLDLAPLQNEKPVNRQPGAMTVNAPDTAGKASQPH
jgi:hypothetical protein